MRTIHKFEIVGNGRFQLPLPDRYRILHIDVQGNTPFMWVELETNDTPQWNTFIIRGTGWDVESSINDDEFTWHVGTWLQGPWVWHLYQIAKKDWFWDDSQADEEDGEQQIA